MIRKVLQHSRGLHRQQQQCRFASTATPPGTHDNEILAKAWAGVKTAVQQRSRNTDPTNRLGEMLEYTCWGGKMLRARVVMQLGALAGQTGTEERVKAATLGLMIELLQAYFLVLDDIMDGSQTRRGQPCWYLREGVTTSLAINDGCLLRSYIFYLIKHFYGSQPYYLHLLELFNEATLVTELGQMMDVLWDHTARNRDFSQLTAQSYDRVVTHKTTFYTVYLPLALGLVLTGDFPSRMASHELSRIAHPIGHYFQSKDDMLDCYGDPSVTGKIGTDIQEGKRTWLAVNFWAVADSAQKAEFSEHYGLSEPEHVQRIRSLYDEVGVPKLFAAYEHQAAQDIAKLVKGSQHIPHLRSALSDLWGHLYQRQK